MDTIGRRLSIERAVSFGKLKSTKTGKHRDVDLTPRLAEALDRWQAQCEAEALANSMKPSEYVFPASKSGTWLASKDIARQFRVLLRSAGLPRFRLYDLRHTFASHLLAGNPPFSDPAPITYVSAQLGHETPTTTLAYYAHWLPRGDQRYMNGLEAARTASQPSCHQDPPKSGDKGQALEAGSIRLPSMKSEALSGSGPYTL